jgi:hypothetical protein
MTWDPIDILEAMGHDPLQMQATLDEEAERRQWLAEHPSTVVSVNGELVRVVGKLHWRDRAPGHTAQPSTFGSQLPAHIESEPAETTLKRKSIEAALKRDDAEVKRVRLHTNAALILAGCAPQPGWFNVKRKTLYKTILHWSYTLGLQFKTKRAVRRYVVRNQKTWPKQTYALKDAVLTIGGQRIDSFDYADAIAFSSGL